MSSACGSEAGPQHVSFDANGARYGLFLFLDDAGGVVRRLTPELAPSGQAIDAKPHHLELQEGEVDIVFIGLSASTLERLVPLLDDKRVEDLSVESGAWTCGPRSVDYDALMVHIPVPAEALLLRRYGGDASFVTTTPRELSFLSSLALGFPIDFDRCFDGGTPVLRSFGDHPGLIPDGATVAGQATEGAEGLTYLYDVARLEDDRILAAGDHVAFFFERGRPYEDVPERVRWFSRSHGVGRFIDYDPRPNLEARAVYVATQPSGAAAAGLHELVMDERGLGFVRTATASNQNLNGVIVDELGRVVTVDDDGQTWRMEAGGSQLDSHRLSRRLQALTTWGSSPQSHFIVSPDSLFIGDAFTESFDTYSFNTLGIGTLDLATVAVAPRDAAFEVWTTGKSGLIAKLGEEDLEQVELDWDPRWRDCTSGVRECGVTSLSDTIRSLSIDVRDGQVHLYMLGASCRSAVIAANVSKNCAVALRPPPEEGGQPVQLFGLDLQKGWLTVSGTNGRVYELRL